MKGISTAALLEMKTKRPPIETAREPLAEKTSARKKTQPKPGLSEAIYRAVVDVSPEAIFLHRKGRFIFLNPAARRIFGPGDGSDLIGEDFLSYVMTSYRQRMSEQIRIVNEHRTTAPSRELQFLSADGRVIDVECASTHISAGGDDAILTIAHDITHQKKLEAQLLHAEKMEAIGTLAGGFAHDFNNIMMGILGYASLMLMDMDPTHPHYDNLKRIEQQVRNATELTAQLLGFARSGKYEVRATDLNDLVTTSSKMFGRTKKEIVIRRNLQQDLRPVEVDRGQIEQVLLNLYLNSWQAMPSGGEILIETRNVALYPQYCSLHNADPGEYVKVSITDTGIGMDEATQKRVFEPFFTTKRMGRGTGLGLASAYGIIKNHGGIIDVYSEKGRGSTFHIYLPITDKAPPSDIIDVADLIKGTGTVLIVDDQELALNVGKEMLRSLGYEVLTATDGRSAVEIYAATKDVIRLVILDMIMPVMGGGETFDALKALDPDVRVLLSSGYSADGDAAFIISKGCRGFLQKPFDLSELSQKVHKSMKGEI